MRSERRTRCYKFANVRVLMNHVVNARNVQANEVVSHFFYC